MSQMYEVVITATGEVRDADGNLISSEPVEARMTMTEEQVKSMIEGE
jgi:hypothetical protein